MGLKILKNYITWISFPLLIILIWELFVKVDIFPNQSIAAPSDSLMELWKLIFTKYLWKHIGYSLYRLLIGFAFGAIFGILLGWLVGYYRTWSKLLEPTILTFIPVPPIAWIPFLIALMSLSDISKSTLIAIGVFNVLFISTSEGVRNTDKKLLEMAFVFGKNQKQILYSIIFPSVLKYILGNLRIAMALSFTLLLASEMINASSGLGWLIMDARRFSRAEEMIVGIVVIGFLGKFLDFSIVKFSNYLLRWDTTLRNEKSMYV